MVEGLPSKHRGHGGHRRVLDEPLRPTGGRRFGSGAGGPSLGQTGAWTQERRAGLPMAATVAHLWVAARGFSTRLGRPGFARAMPATGRYRDERRRLPAAGAKGPGADE